jgi:putative ABC transport system ATP-binding protein
MTNQPKQTTVTKNKLAVHCRDITKTYTTGAAMDVMALRGVNLDIIDGEFLILAGPSGCGKTTLISVIAGILNQTQGECIVFDEDIYNLTEMERLRFRATNIGFVFQQFNLLPTLTAAENVAIPLVINGMSMKNAAREGSLILAEMGLGGRQNSLPNELSGGQQQRVAIARAIIHNPRLVVCDEPTSSLDAKTGKLVMELMRSLATVNNRTMVIVTHD